MTALPHTEATHIQSHQWTPSTAVYCTKLASCPRGRSCLPRPWLTHRSGAFTHLDPLALPPAGSHRLTSPHIGFWTSLCRSSCGLHMFFLLPCQQKVRVPQHQLTLTHSHAFTCTHFIYFFNFLMYVKCTMTYTVCTDNSCKYCMCRNLCVLSTNCNRGMSPDLLHANAHTPLYSFSFLSVPSW